MSAPTNPAPSVREGEEVGQLERVRHVKRGTEYEVLGEAEAQSSNGVRHFVDGRNVTVYRCLKTGKLWALFTDEFRDGRFETIASAPVPDKSGVGGDVVSHLPRKPDDCALIAEALEAKAERLSPVAAHICRRLAAVLREPGFGDQGVGSAA